MNLSSVLAQIFRGDRRTSLTIDHDPTREPAFTVAVASEDEGEIIVEGPSFDSTIRAASRLHPDNHVWVDHAARVIAYLDGDERHIAGQITRTEDEHQ